MDEGASGPSACTLRSRSAVATGMGARLEECCGRAGEAPGEPASQEPGRRGAGTLVGRGVIAVLATAAEPLAIDADKLAEREGANLLAHVAAQRQRLLARADAAAFQLA